MRGNVLVPSLLLLIAAGCAKVTQPDVTVSEASQEELAATIDVNGGQTPIFMKYDDPPRLTKMVQPKYPEAAKAGGISGKVVLSMVVDEEGNVTDAEVVMALPKDLFEEAALSAVKQWKFEPATVEGKPVKVRIGQNVEFTLKERSIQP